MSPEGTLVEGLSERDRVCAHCGKQGHHRSLCLKLFGNTDQRPNPATQNTTTTTEAQNISNVVEEMMLTSGRQVQMQTATSMVTTRRVVL